MSEVPQTDLEIKRAAQLSLTEICIGSVGHGFKIPLTGQVLSLNQLAFLLNALNRDHLPRSATFEISSIAAILKSFSPAGQKLGPMLSIAMQGFLFWAATTAIGIHIFGQIIGAVLLSLWAFVQPLITLFIIYGTDLILITRHYLQRLRGDYEFVALSLGYAIAALIALKICIAIALVIYSRKSGREIRLISENKLSRLVVHQMPAPSRTPLRSALRDLTRPLFLLSFILMLVFIWQLNSSLSQKIWLSLRPLGIAFILFYTLRSPWVAQKLISLSQKSPRFAKIYKKSQAALSSIKK